MSELEARVAVVEESTEAIKRDTDIVKGIVEEKTTSLTEGISRAAAFAERAATAAEAAKKAAERAVMDVNNVVDGVDRTVGAVASAVEEASTRAEAAADASYQILKDLQSNAFWFSECTGFNMNEDGRVDYDDPISEFRWGKLAKVAAKTLGVGALAGGGLMAINKAASRGAAGAVGDAINNQGGDETFE